MRKYEEVSRETESLDEVRKTVKELQKEVESLINKNKVSGCSHTHVVMLYVCYISIDR